MACVTERKKPGEMEPGRCSGLTGDPPKYMSMSLSPEPMTVTLSEKKSLANIIKCLGLRRSSWIIQVGPHPMTSVLIDRRDFQEESMWRWRQRLEPCGHKPMKAGPPPKAGMDLPLSLQRKCSFVEP